MTMPSTPRQTRIARQLRSAQQELAVIQELAAVAAAHKSERWTWKFDNEIDEWTNEIDTLIEQAIDAGMFTPEDMISAL